MRPPIEFKITPEGERLLEYYTGLEMLHVSFDRAAMEFVDTFQVPICIPGCGVCCTTNSVLAYGIEVEYLRSRLLGMPDLINPIIDRCRDWLIKPGKYTYGSKINSRIWAKLKAKGELAQVGREPCVLQGDDKQCMVHFARPMACRAYGVTHVCGPECPRPLSLKYESAAHGTRGYFNPHSPHNNIYALEEAWFASITERKYTRQGFLATLLFEMFRPKELAGLLYDGRVPLVKVSEGWGFNHMALWQDQIDRDWSEMLAEQSIASAPKFKEVDGVPRVLLGVK